MSKRSCLMSLGPDTPRNQQDMKIFKCSFLYWEKFAPHDIWNISAEKQKLYICEKDTIKWHLFSIPIVMGRLNPKWIELMSYHRFSSTVSNTTVTVCANVNGDKWHKNSTACTKITWFEISNAKQGNYSIQQVIKTSYRKKRFTTQYGRIHLQMSAAAWFGYYTSHYTL